MKKEVVQNKREKVEEEEGNIASGRRFAIMKESWISSLFQGGFRLGEKQRLRKF
jgi:hypothetical protein